ncbi:DUF6957 family protein [Pseudomonas viridiflava]|uniref:DUF6957 family protein n=2 Tax=Pseudomonas viridiflava TaxID=33069 RepID=UPI003C6E45B9
MARGRCRCLMTEEARMLAVAEMQSLTGERVFGASLASTEAIERKLELTTKPVCFVRAWVIIDVDGVDPSVTQGSHLLPLVMYSHYVVSHGTDQLARGDKVLTGFATHYDPRGIFETATWCRSSLSKFDPMPGVGCEVM